MLEKTDAVGIPVWIISLDLLKAFDRLIGPALGGALVDEGLPDHLVWMLQCVYFGQYGELVGDLGPCRNCNITGGARAKSTFVLCGVAMGNAKRRAEVGNIGFNLMDGGPTLLDLRFADIFIFAQSAVETCNLSAALVKQLGGVGLLFNREKRIVITNEAEPPQTIVIVRVLPRDAGQKRLASMLTLRRSKLQKIWIGNIIFSRHRKVFHMNRWILQDRNVSIGNAYVILSL